MLNLELVPGGGLEPPRPCGQRILSPLRLPFRHPGIRKTVGHYGGHDPLIKKLIGYPAILPLKTCLATPRMPTSFLPQLSLWAISSVG